MLKFLGPHCFLGDDPNCSTADLPPAVWQSVVEFRLLISVCKTWQWRRKQNLHRLGTNGGPVWSRLWTKVHVVLRGRRRPFAVVNALDRSSKLISCFIPKIQAVKVAVKLRSRRKKVVFGPPICNGRGYPRFRTCVFKLHLLPSMWPTVVEFRSASSAIKRQKKEKRRKKNPW